ncbi:HTH-type transcriptional regulator PksA [Geomicrobium sp. JCM 19037]|uniref:TetR/AcrR family transcriptional regulator n=1 Tax=unclassified Geomicrobium TaxID=2628951 RepID=UPI00045F464C|nr:TetR/AcrR family transcriptional regulator [Geomicrobium sp. JCM 19037]GAK05600.1 HTH-type transcriptional regulator PksA [Geomicrobium sp. JCM 19037]
MPKVVDHYERKKIIAEACIRMIDKTGVEKTTLREIAREVGYSLGSVQYYFPKQEDLFSFTIQMLYERTAERINNVVLEGNTTIENAVSMLTQYVQIENEEQRIENNVWVKFVLVSEKQREYKEMKDRYVAMCYRFVEDALNMLEAGHCLADGESKQSELENLTIFMNGIVFHTIIFPESYDEDHVKKQIRSYLDRICRP